ncbi:hypothetical protein LR48_Vigan10g112400 [Vigna angularis]|uniref:Uncharacterized protein n=1 Tax=Phaseolus angularis TaxID=3914 RepID=A0A0L9VJY9_PHAAN|nr:hypothetical protein LR48_Vigan10g112400 [Vigna angularis]
MTGQGSECPDKGKGVARPKKRQRKTPKYVLRVPARRPTIAAPGTSSVGPPPTSTIQPLTPVVHPSPTPAAHPSTTPAAYLLPPLVIITPTPPPVIITPTPLPDPTSIPSSSCILPSKTVTPSADPDSSGDGEGLDPPLHDRPLIEPYGKRFIPSRVASQAITRSIKQQFLSPWPTWEAIPDDDRKPFWERFQEEFSTRISQVRSEHESAPTPDDGSNAEDDIPRSAPGLELAGAPPTKGRWSALFKVFARWSAVSSAPVADLADWRRSRSCGNSPSSSLALHPSSISTFVVRSSSPFMES